jgi:peptidoglycan/xylan/chitin deacetylase (PgdA/CDA1 family)
MKSGILLVMVILLWLTVPSSALFAPGDRQAVIRIDDIQDYGGLPDFALAQQTVLQYHVDSRTPALLAIIASRFGTEPQLIDQIKTGLNLKVFSIGLHGWHHERMTNLTMADQVSQLKLGKNRVEAALGIEVRTLVPPYGDFDKDTIEAMKTVGFTMMSSAVFEGDLPREEGGILYIPQTVTSATVDLSTDSWVPLTVEEIRAQIVDSWDKYGVATMVIHPRQFLTADGVWSLERWDIYLRIIQWIQANEGSLMIPTPPSPQPSQPPPWSNINPFFLSVAAFTGLTSTLLIAFNISARRKRRRAGEIGVISQAT